MRQISNKVFWEIVKKSLGEERHKEIENKFNDAMCKPQTPESIRELVCNELIPIMEEAARINGCRNVNTERAYQIEVLEIYLEATKEFPRILTDPDSITEEENTRLKTDRLYPRYAEVSQRFADRHFCHSHPIEGFTCYCDEKQTKAGL